MRRLFFIVAVSVILVGRLVGAEWAAPVPAGLYDTHDARLFLRDTISGTIDEVLSFSPRVVQQQSVPTRVRISVEQQIDSFYVVFANELDGSYPIYSRGSYVIKRSLTDGRFVQIKVFLQSDPGSFLRIYPEGPDGSRASMDLFLAGSRVYDGVRLAASFEELLLAPFSRIVELSRGIVRWDLVYPVVSPTSFDNVRQMAQRARRMLPSLPDAEDGAMDESGRLVFIEDLVMQEGQPGFNCSGFAKWIADGLFYPMRGAYLSIEALKEKHLGLRGHQWSDRQESERDPYFGLDWCRNIARHLAAESSGALPHPEFADVREVPFSRYVEDVGYPTDELARILYLLAVQEPGHIYLGSVNREFGSDPVLHQHIHVVVFFPYFDESGRFHVSVMERNVETTLDDLHRRYPDDSVHLVRLRAREVFQPPQIEYSR